ncbi:hypothetical protein VHA01S_031_00030 [Vibrio halioticoli NBRC 102217]|uniref:HPr kinase/phosphorylase C-terminal domain-containing protein n=1 Tax=Vibrio halioticoli NBRC 102217 TaxID=1219072 RepID=V5HLC6_9VIBR|nr:hypothetical protein [Vibrio halioticoli]GAD89990.1 hypothetical protein VHA01S_031_00030 [Vibrio halioticoli NBRC 102217]
MSEINTRIETKLRCLGIEYDISAHRSVIEPMSHYLRADGCTINKRVKIDAQCIHPTQFHTLVSELETHSLSSFDVFKGKTILGDGHRFYFEQEPCLVDVHDDEIRIFSTSLEPLKYMVLRVIREHLYRSKENAGYVSFHSAFSQVAEHGLMYVGTSGAGKTTLLLATLEHLAGLYLCNDRVLISEKDVCTIPLPIRISLETATNSKKLNPFITSEYFDLTRPQCINHARWEGIKHQYNTQFKDTDDKFELSPLEVERCLNNTSLNHSKLDYIVFPRFDPTVSGLKAEPISEESSVRILRQELYTPNDKLWVDPWVVARDHEVVNLQNSHAFIDSLVSDRRRVALTYGPDLNLVLASLSPAEFIKILESV